MWKKFIQITFLFCLIPLNQAFSQTDPFFLCIERLNEGSTELFWSAPSIGGAIMDYEIWAGRDINGYDLRKISTVSGTTLRYIVSDKSFFVFRIRAIPANNSTPIISNILTHQESEVELITSNIQGDKLYLEWKPYHDGAGQIEYFIYQKKEEGDVLIKMVKDKTTALVDLNELVESNVFSIVAVDQCGNSSPPYYFNYLFLASGGVDMCTKSIKLFWNAYLLPNSQNYTVQEFRNGNWEHIASTPNQRINIIYKDETEKKLRISLKADTGETIYSNELVFEDLPEYKPQQFLEIESISFGEDNNVKIKWSSDVNQFIGSLAAEDNYYSWDVNPTNGPMNVLEINSQDLLPITKSDLGRGVQLNSNDVCKSQFLSEIISWPFLFEEQKFENHSFETVSQISKDHKIIRYEWVVNNTVLPSADYQGHSISIPKSFFQQEENIVYVKIYTDFTDHSGNISERIFESNRIKISSTSSIPNAISLSQQNGQPIHFVSNPNLIETYQISVYDRLGGKIFYSKNPQEAWHPSNIQTPTTLIYHLVSKVKDKDSTVSVGTILIID